MLIPNFSLWTWYLILQAGSFFFGGSTLALIMYRSGISTWSLFLQLVKDLSKKEEFSIFVLMMAVLVFCALFPCLGYISFAKEFRGKRG